jgi:hypothetical protein
LPFTSVSIAAETGLFYKQSRLTMSKPKFRERSFAFQNQTLTEALNTLKHSSTIERRLLSLFNLAHLQRKTSYQSFNDLTRILLMKMIS